MVSLSQVADCLSKLPGNNLSTFIKLSADTIKREQELEDSPLSAQSAEAMTGELVTTVEEDPLAHECQTTEMAVGPDGSTAQIIVMTPGDKKNTKVKKKYKKKPPKQRRQMPGRVSSSLLSSACCLMSLAVTTSDGNSLVSGQHISG